MSARWGVRVAGGLLLTGCGAWPWSRADVPPVLEVDPCTDPVAWFADDDADGFGDPSRQRMSCAEMAGWSLLNTDCDDGERGTFPGAIEVCDGVDRDCDGRIDADAVDAPTWYLDLDGDGFGRDIESITSCVAPADHVASPGDCDDSDVSVNPGASEVPCDGVDQDCDGTVESGAAQAVNVIWSSLQEALDAHPDGPIYVCDGGEHPVQYEQVGGDLDLIGASVGEPPRLVPSSGGRMLSVIDGGMIRLQGLVFANGIEPGAGGAASIEAREIYISNVVFRDNQAARDGGGLHLRGTSEDGIIELRAVTAHNNHADGNGGGVAIDAQSCAVSVELKTESNRSEVDGGGVSITTANQVWLDIAGVNDSAAGDGGVLAVSGADVSVEGRVSASGGRAGGDGGGVSVVATGTLRLMQTGSVVSGCQADGQGGGLSLRGDTVQVPFEIEPDLCTAGTDGGGIAVVAGTGGFDLRVAATGNVAAGRGGGVFAITDQGAIVLSTGLLENNRSAAGGGVFVAGPSPGSPAARFKVSAGDFTNNAADVGAGMLVERAGVAKSDLSVSVGDMLRNSGGVALRVEGAIAGKVRGADLLGNTGGGIAVPDSVALSVTGYLGTSTGNNGPFDTLWGTTKVDATGSGRIAIECSPGAGCEVTE